MQYLTELPEVSSIGVDGDIIELELNQEIEELSEFAIRQKPVVLVANYAGQIVVAVGQVIEHKTVKGGPEVWCRIKIKGSSVTFTI